MNINSNITFILNDQTVTASCHPGLLALDYVRQREHLTGTKEGCKEGDCGACTVLLGELIGNEVHYRPMTSCLMPMGQLGGKHLVTIEGLNMDELSPVQAAMVDTGGTQCGYCTPGFIVAMTAGLMDERLPLDREGLLYAISGNLCRCTGYRSIKEAGQQVFDQLGPQINGGNRVAELCRLGALPDYFLDIPQRLSKLAEQAAAKPNGVNGAADHSANGNGSSQQNATPPTRYRIAGGTDLYVQRGEEIPDGVVDLLDISVERRGARLEGGMIVMTALTTFEDLNNDPIFVEAVPDIRAYNDLIASWPVRTRSTLGGNICNASPIADMTSLLLALDAELQLEGGDRPRIVALRDFYLGYKKLAKEPDEIVAEIRFPKPAPHERVNWEKVSKRVVLDIATINAGAKLGVEAGRITSASLSLGGVAAIPLYLREASTFLVGKPLVADVVAEALNLAQTEFDPISDVRGSAEYKRLLARQLLMAHFTKLFPETFSLETLHAAL